MYLYHIMSTQSTCGICNYNFNIYCFYHLSVHFTQTVDISDLCFDDCRCGW